MTAILFLSVVNGYLASGFGSIQRNCRNIKRKGQKFVLCAVTVDGFWDFRVFRQWSDKKNYSRSRKIILDIRCTETGSVFLPWPMRARNLYTLNVEGCLIKGYFSEFLNETRIPDTLSKLTIRDCVIETSMQSQMERAALVNHISKSYDCGQQDTLVEYITSNITYKFMQSDISLINNIDFSLLDSTFQALEDHHKDKTYTCRYPKMERLETSESSSRSKLFYQFLADNYYPRLRFLNLSANSLPHSSDRLRDWSRHFPALEQLDLSNNFIQDFEFRPSTVAKSLYVNLQNNNIKKIPSSILESLKGDLPVVVDVRKNPIDCKYCSTKLLKNYLAEVVTRYASHGALLDVRCSRPYNLRGKRVIDLPSNLICVQ